MAPVKLLVIPIISSSHIHFLSTIQLHEYIYARQNPWKQVFLNNSQRNCINESQIYQMKMWKPEYFLLEQLIRQE